MSDDSIPMHPTDASWEIPAKRPWRLLALGLAALLAVDLVLSLVQADGPDPSLALDSRDDVRLVLKRAIERDARVLIGDSVLAGDVLAGHTSDWQSERVLDHMRREAGEGAGAFEQVALSGVLLGDVLGVLYELDDLDPQGTVPVVIEVNPRVFSVHYGETRCAHPWLCDRVEAGDDGWLWAWNTAGREVRDALDAAEPWLPVLRHRRRLFPSFDPVGTVLGGSTGDGPDAVEARARLLAHYRDPALADEDLPVRLLGRIGNRLRSHRRQATLFTTPLNDAFLGDATSPSALGHLSAQVDAAIADSPARLVQLDHPLFRPEHFVDHCHLTPAGSRILAINLLHELGQPLADIPLRGEVVHPLDVEQTLVAHPDPGNAEGPSWVARFQDPRGVAVGPAGQVVVADTGNDRLALLSPPHHTTRTLLSPSLDGIEVDGPLAEATVLAPSYPVFVGPELYFLSDDGQALRRLKAGQIETVLRRVGLPALVEIKRVGPRLVARDARHAVWRIDLDRREQVRIALPPVGRAVSAIEAIGQRVFIADGAGRITEHPLFPKGGAKRVEAGTLVFANAGPQIPHDPQPKDISRFPRRFDEERIGAIEGLDWIDRYEGLLVRYRHIGRRRGAAPTPTPGDSHWRFFDLEERRITPWIRARPFGSSHLMWSRPQQSYVSPNLAGDVAIDQRTATVFHLEHDRSRLVRRGDGLLGAARVSHPGTTSNILDMQEVFGDRMARMTLEDHDPVSHLEHTAHPHGLDEPYVVLVVGASMLSMSDTVGQYSLVRVLEERLRERLGYRDRESVLVFSRIRAGSDFPAMVALTESAIPAVRPDLVVVDMWQRARPGPPVRPDRYDDAIGRLVALRASTGAEVMVLDSTPLDRLRSTPAPLLEQHDALRSAGFEVISSGGEYLHDTLAVAPWGSPPFFARPPTPWAIEAAGERLAAQLYPVLRARTEQGPPAWTRGPMDSPQDLSGTLAEVRAELESVDREALPLVEPTAALVSLEGDRLEILLDLRDRPETAEQQPALALAAVLAVILDNRGTDVAREIQIRLVTFASYDEYGQGAREAATTVHEATWTPAELVDEATSTGP